MCNVTRYVLKYERLKPYIFLKQVSETTELAAMAVMTGNKSEYKIIKCCWTVPPFFSRFPYLFEINPVSRIVSKCHRAIMPLF